MNSSLYPLLTTPVYKDYIWGGRRIPELYARDFAGDICAESWEVSDRSDGMGRVANGALSGKTLRAVVEEYGTLLQGQAAPSGPFPLLIKIIDAKQRLSVQVHPNDETAARFGGEAKSEMWYVLDADPGAFVYAGLKPGTGEADVRAAIESQSLESLLVRIPAHPGQAVYIPGGCLHAIGEGCLLLEVQQNSNTTYRVYDWGRVGHDGRPRELHVEQAMRVTNWSQPAPEPTEGLRITEDPNPQDEILKTPYFRFDRLHVQCPQLLPADEQTCRVLFAAGGECVLESGGRKTPLAHGASCLLPACCDAVLTAPNPGTEVLSVRLV